MATIPRAFRVAHASGGDWEELTQACLAGMGSAPDGANFGFVYVTDSLDEDMRRIVDALIEATGIRNWVGTIGFGVCVGGEELFDLPAMALMVGSLPRDSFCILPTVKDPADGVPAEVRDWAARHNPVLGVVHGDPRNGSLERLFDTIQRDTGCFLVGGLTASRGELDQLAGEVTEGGVSGVLFAAEIGVVTGLTQGCTPIGPVHEVTEARDNVVVSLDDRPAVEVFKDEIGEVLSRNLSRIEGYVHAALPIAGSDTGDYLVRNVLGVYPEQGWMSIAEKMAAGDRLMFVRRDGAAAMTDLKRMLDDITGRAGGTPRAALYYSCVARGPNLFGRGSVELRTIAEALGDVPLIGFFANGEISNNRLYGYTGVLTLLL